MFSNFNYPLALFVISLVVALGIPSVFRGTKTAKTAAIIIFAVGSILAMVWCFVDLSNALSGL